MSSEIKHYGTPRHSGRYPWGSGENPYQHTADFIARIDELKSKGLSEVEIAKDFKLSTTQFRTQRALAYNERRSELAKTAKTLRERGLSYDEIANKMGYKNDSSVRTLLNEKTAIRKMQSQKTAEALKDIVKQKGMIMVGKGVERELGVSREKLNEALYILERDGYPTYGGRVPQATNPGKFTTIKVLCPPGTEHKEIFNFENIKSASDYINTEDGGQTFKTFKKPESMDSKRIMVKYAEDGGIDKDGVIEIRRGVKDLSLGDSHYAQIRVLVDGDKYIKGMGIYSDDLPDGIDVIVNSNKKKGTSLDDVLKPVKRDNNNNVLDNPFGAYVPPAGQSEYIDEKGNKRLNLINKTRSEGEWEEWSKKIPAQFLSKQKIELIDKQLNISKTERAEELEKIKNVTNPTIKKQLLETYASDCDSTAVSLKAASFPRQRYQVLLPLTTIKDTEVYAPNYKDGEKIALVRFPHGGTFEIPILTVNNKNKEGIKNITPNALDAVGVSKNTADVLSGADFDGDTVLVIPTSKHVQISSKPPLSGLKGFDSKSYQYTSTKVDKNGEEHYYFGDKEYKVMPSKTATGNEMGKITNLITDMTLKNATDSEITRAVKYSMVVIDAYKHKLDYRQCAIDNDIKGLKKKYQGRITAEGKYSEGAGSLISLANSKAVVTKRTGTPWINTDTGELEWTRKNPKTGKIETKYVHETYTDKSGKIKERTINSTKMAETKDARTLSTGHPVEEIYASYANYLKGKANEARKIMVNEGRLAYSPSAKKAYANEVESLNKKLNISLSNQPKENMAQIMVAGRMKAITQEIPELKNDKKELKKVKQRELEYARAKVGAKRQKIDITDKEWEAIQAGAITENVLKNILKFADIDDLRERATPKNTRTITPATQARIKAMAAGGYTNAQIAKALNLSTSTIQKYLK